MAHAYLKKKLQKEGNCEFPETWPESPELKPSKQLDWDAPTIRVDKSPETN